jgi:hypothetical protein
MRLDMDWEADYARTLNSNVHSQCLSRLSRMSRGREVYLSTRIRGYDQDFFNPAADTLYISPWFPPIEWTVNIP